MNIEKDTNNIRKDISTLLLLRIFDFTNPQNRSQSPLMFWGVH